MTQLLLVLKTAVALLKELSPFRYGMLVLSVFSGIALWAMWEQRQAVFITVTGSVFAMFTIGFGISMVLTTISNWSFNMAERKRNDELVAELRRQNAQEREETRKEVEELKQAIHDTEAREQRRCDEKMALQEKRLQDLIIASRHYPRVD